MARIFLILLLILPAQLALAADAGFPGIETLMTTAERQATGIENLSPQELESLNAWIERYASGAIAAPADAAVSAVPVPAVAPEAPATVAPDAAPADDFRQAPEQIDFVSRIDGEFEGWSGRTRFTLENGQVWEQRRSSRWKVSLDSPEVRIWQNFMGAFEMEVLSEGRSIGVRRIR